MPSDFRCRRCGSLLPDDAPEGNCPSCLLGLALGGTEDVPQLASADGGDSISSVHYFGDYELRGEIARGGMGIVFRARQVSLNRPVALKMILSGQLASAAQVQRFQTEAEAAAKLDHPNIVPIYEIGRHEGKHYYSMKLVEGGSIAARMADKEWRKDSRRAAKLVATAARAVHYAHQHGILHRDLKPTNILVDADGQPHVTDFGLAKIAESGDDSTRTIAVLGTPAYMSPEQAAGHGRQVSTAADVYSLGAILYELLAGKPPFGGLTALETLRQTIEEEPQPPGKLNPRLDHDLEIICLTCLRKEPQERYGSALALAEDLERWLAGEPILARPASGPERLWRWCRRNPKTALLSGSVLFLLMVVAVGSTWEVLRVKQANRAASEKLFDSYLAQARAVRRGGREGQRFESLDAAIKAAAIHPSAAVRSEVIASLAMTDVRFSNLRRVSESDGDREVWSPQLDLRAFAVGDGTLRIVKPETGQEVAVVPARSVPSQRLDGFSQDGRYLAVRSGTNAARSGI